MSNRQLIAEQCYQILFSYGEFESDLINVYSTYKDKKIKIKGRINNQKVFDLIFVTLLLKTRTEDPPTFELPRTSSEETIVFRFRIEKVQTQRGEHLAYMPEFMREGMWINYIEEKYNDIMKKIEEFDNIKNTPIYDADLFDN